MSKKSITNNAVIEVIRNLAWFRFNRISSEVMLKITTRTSSSEIKPEGRALKSKNAEKIISIVFLFFCLLLISNCVNLLYISEKKVSADMVSSDSGAKVPAPEMVIGVNAKYSPTL